MAYVLGFFTADGNMIKNKRGAHFISIEITDLDILERMREVIGSNHRIGVRKKKFPNKIAYRLQIGSRIMFDDLLKLGLMPAKSKIVDLPKIPEEYFSEFVRGYFDGDGSVTISNYIRKDRNNTKRRIILSGFTSGSKEFLRNMHLELKKFAFIIGGTFHFSGRGYRLYFSVTDSLKLYNFMYRKVENDLFLSRKKIKFEKYFKI
ncbi:MAG: hypothetical protein A3A98_02200 [Candidatus Staskawiczbacteria bacterium RIFCSPLOWO2_01_FULL_40_39]|nr:MAG: hypothetical protein A3A98_02200 [Candidatus Staskawiczbacteria bacterium RIFCSPLOWO2_01_FULL_40_39]OGZ76250.1 MAG: hypothetical protein A3I87_02260 [Candidatus Staskawiczbacteria bacterium RIFCSPLOWO2_02_FULL_39_8]